MKVVNLLGGPGSGKSTTAAGVFYFMKLQGFNVELVTEYAKEIVYDGTMDTMLDRQEVIFAEQNQRLHRLRGKVDYAITDSPLLLSCVYPDISVEQQGITPWPALDAFKKFVIAVFSTYNNENFYLHRPDTFQEDGRYQDQTQAVSVDQRVLDTLTEHKFPFTSCKTDLHTADNIIQTITS